MLSPPDKASLRAQYLQKRVSISPSHAAECAQAFTRHALGFIDALNLPAGAVIAGYMPIKGEIDAMPLLAALSAQGFRCALPRVSADALTFHAWKPGVLLVSSQYGIPALPASAEKLTPACIIAPLLAFDRSGARLGYGGGYYDRTIRNLRASGPRVHYIGAAFAMQEAGALPATLEDEHLDDVITESGCGNLS